jgi:hypothetical protein
LRIDVSQACEVRLRIPEFTSAAQMQVEVNGQPPSAAEPHPLRAVGNYLEIGRLQAGDQIQVSYPLPVSTEEIAVGNPGYRQWPYRVTWKGDTVVRMEALEHEVRSAYSDFDQAERDVFYGPEGPGLLYQREHMLPDSQPAEAEIHLDDGGLDLWKIGRLQ